MAISAGTGFVDLLPRINTALFSAAANAQLKPAINNMQGGIAKSFASLGPTLGAVVAGTAVVAVGKLTLAFEDAFTRIAAISNASAQQIAGWRDSVFDLARATAVAPRELADGLFFLASAGLKANEIFPALEASAKGAAVGLGEMEDITRTVAQVLNAFPDAGLEAIDVVDALTAAVRESTAEPEEFAQALGRLLPIASKASVGVEELVASLATLSNIGLDVDEGVTGVRQVLNLIVSPGKQATETMTELGISAEGLRDRLAEDGLINTLRFLEERVGGNEERFRKLIPNIRAMTAAFGLTVQEAAKVDGIFRRIANSSGDVGKALEETQAGPGFKFRQLMVTLQTAAIRLGQVFLPILTKIAQAFTLLLTPVAEVLSLLSKMPVEILAISAAFAGFFALKAIPAILFGIAKGLALIGLIRAPLALAALADMAENVLPKLLTALRAAGPAAIGVTLLTGALVKLHETNQANELKRLERYRKQIIDFGRFHPEAADAVAALRAEEEKSARFRLRNQVISEGFFESYRNGVQLVGDQVGAAAEKELDRLQDLHEASAIRNADVLQIQDALDTIDLGAATRQLAALTEQPFSKFSEGLQTALADGQTDMSKWAVFVEKTVEQASGAFDEFQQDASESIGFVIPALGELSAAATSAQEELAAGTDATGDALAQLREDANLTVTEVFDVLTDKRRDMRDFAKDVLDISRVSGRAGEQAAQAILAMGEGGQALADLFSDAATPEQRERFVRLFADIGREQESLANQLTRRLLGTMKQIRELLEDIAVGFGLIPDPDVNTTEAQTKLDLLMNRLNEINGTVVQATAVVSVERREGGPLPDELAPRVDPRRTATGAVIPAASGGITRRPTILAGEGRYSTPFNRGSEGILPLDDRTMGRLGSTIARQIELPTIVVKVGEEELARTVTRGQRRRRSLVGA